MRTDGNGGKMTVHDNVVITGAFGITMLTDFEAHILSNAHATAVIKGIAKDRTGSDSKSNRGKNIVLRTCRKCCVEAGSSCGLQSGNTVDIWQHSS